MMLARRDLDNSLESLARGFIVLALKSQNPVLKYGGEGGILTTDPLRITRFRGVLLQPLGHLSVKAMLIGSG